MARRRKRRASGAWWRGRGGEEVGGRGRRGRGRKFGVGVMMVGLGVVRMMGRGRGMLCLEGRWWMRVRSGGCGGAGEGWW